MRGEGGGEVHQRHQRAVQDCERRGKQQLFFSIFCTFYQVCENVPEEVCQEVTKEECEKVFVFVFDQFFFFYFTNFLFFTFFFTIFCVSR